MSLLLMVIGTPFQGGSSFGHDAKESALKTPLNPISQDLKRTGSPFYLNRSGHLPSIHEPLLDLKV